MKRLNRIINFILISFSLSLIIISSLVINDLSKLEPLKLKELKNINNKSYIYSDDLTVIKEINENIITLKHEIVPMLNYFQSINDLYSFLKLNEIVSLK